jgi:enamine deaminase RidA (YjgF/YER057c/UK114 family)
MSVELIRIPAGLGEPLGRYSHLSVARGIEIVTVAGQCGIDEGGEIVGDKSVTAQTRQAFANIATALQHVGLQPYDIFKTTTFLVGADNIDEFMAARAEVFAAMFPSGEYPPNTLLVVSRLVEARFAVEIEANAMRPAASA